MPPGSPDDRAGQPLVSRLRAAGCVFAEEEAALLLDAATGPAELAAMADRRLAGEPLEQVLGWAAFLGLRILVEPGVFVPRRRTELLARHAVSIARGRGGRPVVVDLCCGSGAVGAAVLAGAGDVELHAADCDPAAVRCARRNLEPHGGIVHEGDLFEALPPSLLGGVDVLVANAPYVPTDAVATMPPEARLHEPPGALDGGPDGLGVLLRVIAGAPGWLAPGGAVLVECSDRQAPEVERALRRGGLVPRILSSDDLEATAVIGHAPARPPGAR